MNEDKIIQSFKIIIDYYEYRSKVIKQTIINSENLVLSFPEEDLEKLRKHLHTQVSHIDFFLVWLKNELTEFKEFMEMEATND